jgi:DNA processing protein
MTNAIYFKWLQRKNKFRNPDSILKKPNTVSIPQIEIDEIQKYLVNLKRKNISYTYPSDINYPTAFYSMKDPPLFLEYIGTPVWNQNPIVSVIGSRKSHPLTQKWIQSELFQFLIESKMTVVSGGARGADQAAHLISIKANVPTIVVLPTGLENMYPRDLMDLRNEILYNKGCFVSEFESDQHVQKSFFYLRNRLIAAFGNFCVIVQAGEKSGTMLTVHHALEFGRPVVTIPSHPMLVDFAGNIKLIQEGAFPICNSSDLLLFWQSESWSGPVFKVTPTTYGVAKG